MFVHMFFIPPCSKHMIYPVEKLYSVFPVIISICKMEHILKFLGVLLIFESAVCSERCSFYEDSFFYTVRCAYGCCGDIHGPYCCNFSVIGGMVGIVTGCVFGLMLVHIAVCCCLRKCRRKSATNYYTRFNNTDNVQNELLSVE